MKILVNTGRIDENRRGARLDPIVVVSEDGTKNHVRRVDHDGFSVVCNEDMTKVWIEVDGPIECEVAS